MIKTPHCISIYVYIYIWLVVWNIAFIFHNIWVVILPIDELIFFKMVIAPPTIYIYMCTYICITYINIDCFMMIYLLNIVIFHNYICINSCISILWSKTKTCLHYFTLNIWSRGLASGSSRLVLDGKFPWTWGTKTEQLYLYIYICIYVYI